MQLIRIVFNGNDDIFVTNTKDRQINIQYNQIFLSFNFSSDDYYLNSRLKEISANPQKVFIQMQNYQTAHLIKKNTPPSPDIAL